MKKSFLIAGLIAGLTATNGYAVGSQTVVVTYTCHDGCQLITEAWYDGMIVARCKCSDGTVTDPKVSIENLNPSPSEIQQIMSQSTLNQATIKNAKKTKKVSARVAETPKMVKKIVYEEIISDDYTE
ncbi:MAG: hypothetical protein II843_01160 [Alphaproteobacteria bacterium]|nr:hypothetical protein [Alphaproteobacteria bacterium]MBQ6011568.1 hypothetical protein [Alphaproteobacteria bacterium]